MIVLQSAASNPKGCRKLATFHVVAGDTIPGLLSPVALRPGGTLEDTLAPILLFPLAFLLFNWPLLKAIQAYSRSFKPIQALKKIVIFSRPLRSRISRSRKSPIIYRKSIKKCTLLLLAVTGCHWLNPLPPGYIFFEAISLAARKKAPFAKRTQFFTSALLFCLFTFQSGAAILIT